MGSRNKRKIRGTTFYHRIKNTTAGFRHLGRLYNKEEVQDLYTRWRFGGEDVREQVGEIFSDLEKPDDYKGRAFLLPTLLDGYYAMKRVAYPAKFYESNRAYYVTFRDLPECLVIEDTEAEAMAQSRIALQRVLECYDDPPLPSESRKQEIPIVPVRWMDITVARKELLWK